MIRNSKIITTDTDFNFDYFAPRERLVFLDIETTGLKAASSQIYLIGLVSFEEGNWVLTQFFAERRADEVLLIGELEHFLKQKKAGNDHLVLVTYNGDTFDLPFLRTVGKQYGKENLLQSVISLDLLKAIRPYRKLIGLENLKLKTVEKYCGVTREDIYTGGELIFVYEEYLRLSHRPVSGEKQTDTDPAHQEECLHCLLLHNGEDLEDLLPVMSILGYQELFHSGYEAESICIYSPGENLSPVLDLRFRLHTGLPKELYTENPFYVLSVSGEDPLLMEICVPIRHDTLKMYFRDYKNYYYLPAEDMAVHKTLGEFVDRKKRIPASADNCYIREEGDFIPVPRGFDLSGQTFSESRNGMPYIKYKDGMFDKETSGRYALAILQSLLSA